VATNVSQAPVEDHVAEKADRVAQIRKATYITAFVAKETWSWYEAWLPIVIAYLVIARGVIAPLWAVAIGIALAKTRQWRDEVANNLRTTFKNRLILASQLHHVELWKAARIEQVELGPFVGWGDAIKMVARHPFTAVPFWSMTVTVRPPDSAGTGQWADAYADYLRRRTRFSESDHEINKADRNTYIVTLARSVMATKVRLDTAA
jgi:hypothetical protein